MKLTLAAAISLIAISTAANAGEAYPAYTKDKSAWWVSAMFLGPVVGLDAVGRTLSLSGKTGDTFKPLNAATKGIGKHALVGLCNSTVVVTPCK